VRPQFKPFILIELLLLGGESRKKATMTGGLGFDGFAFTFFHSDCFLNTIEAIDQDFRYPSPGRPPYVKYKREHEHDLMQRAKFHDCVGDASLKKGRCTNVQAFTAVVQT